MGASGRVWALRGLVGLCAAGVAGLVLVAVLVDLDTADRVASVVGAVVALVGLVLALWQLQGSSPGSRTKVRGGRAGSVTAGGDMTGNAIGEGSRVTGAPVVPAAGPQPGVPQPGAPAGGTEVVGGGKGSVTAGGNMTGNAIGARSRVTGTPAVPAPGPQPGVPQPGAPAGGTAVVGGGKGSVTAGGNMTGNAIGDESEVG
ncbi:hypothetical protein ACFC58_21455 [Kitasatospora purpeofusca]|uniref:hypothetical protein n=1 Tax=Kitasatospora purpeofusca TaxID=67352 RepID=UPI0035D6BE31